MNAPGAVQAAYALAHLGKSLIWYTSELLLLYSLTEESGLSPVAGSLTLALGLLVNAGMGLWVAALARTRWLSVRHVGRAQAMGVTVSAFGLLLLFLTPHVPAAWRLPFALAVTLPFRMAYAVGDVAQNTLLGLVRWPWRDHRGASALRLMGSAAAALTCCAGLRWSMLRDNQHGVAPLVVLVASGCVVAVGGAWWLASALREARRPVVQHAGAGWSGRWVWPPLAMMVLTSLTMPTFTRLAPFLPRYESLAPSWSVGLLAAFLVGSMVAQPAVATWRWRTAPRLIMLGCTLMAVSCGFGHLAGNDGTLGLALAFAIGLASGAVGHWIWSRHADGVRHHSTGDMAASFARLTAGAQMASAISSSVIGYWLEAVFNRGGDANALLAAMAVGPLCCGSGCVALGVAFLARRSFGDIKSRATGESF